MRKSEAVLAEARPPLCWTRDGVDMSGMLRTRDQLSVELDLQFPAVDCSTLPDLARQEYKESADLKFQVERFGVGVHSLAYGEYDTDVDLTLAHELMERAQGAWLGLPQAVRSKYSSWRQVEEAAASGELEQVLKAAGVTAGGSAGAPAASPSDSAAVPPPKAG